MTFTILHSYLSSKHQALARTFWEIIQIAPTEVPGELRVWALVNGEMHAARVNIYRRFFVNLSHSGCVLRCVFTSVYKAKNLPWTFCFQMKATKIPVSTATFPARIRA
jgi:hypothetical protein